MSCKDFIVPPRSRTDIRTFTTKIREYIDKPSGAFPITNFLEFVMPSLDSEYSFEVCSEAELGDDMGLTSPDRHIIRLREDVYLKACDGDGCARMTCAHELGHYILHSEGQLNFSRTFADDTTPRYMHSEWQANCFGGELLVPVTDRAIIVASDIDSISQLYGVTHQAAGIQRKVCIGERPSSWRN